MWVIHKYDGCYRMLGTANLTWGVLQNLQTLKHILSHYCLINKITFKRTRILSNAVCICHHFFRYLTYNFDDLELGLLKVIQCQRSWCQSKAHSSFPIWFPLCLTLYLSWYSRSLMRKFCHLELGQVIQGQRSWCQSTARGRLPIRLLLYQKSYLSLFLKYLISNFDDLELGQFMLP